ncbi:L-aspartate oxidase [Halonatronum saccharophilum]|uniref:L-aspartate oxidase n=1 Tax=Halonatronum saccharophilum TaxID=150060 RepID=UPI0004873AFF|nr:L-aspartate oxidase [Halonatronum saccharophilum]
MVPRYLINFDLNEIKKKSFDFIVVGSGAAGLTAALELGQQGQVALLTKGEVKESNTKYAQGGVAATFSPEDRTRFHYRDTLLAGDGLCNPKAVKTLVEEGPTVIKRLIEEGAKFDRKKGKVALTKEGGHSHRRVLHAGGDATGRELSDFLIYNSLYNKNIEIFENTFAVDLISDENGVYGLLAYDKLKGEYLLYLAKAVVLATGGIGQLYKNTSNPQLATGDGVAMAYRAGAEVMDMEFIQFHPTTLALEGANNFLLSEALRGEGGILRNSKGEIFMDRYHPLKELAPRDIVARAIYHQMEKEGSSNLYLDLSHLDNDFIKGRFPTIYNKCLSLGLDISKDQIPITPAAHYFMGGIKVDLFGRSSLKGLFACGEAASFGLHGANRLASNSLLETLVYGERVAKGALDYTKKAKIRWARLDLNLRKDIGDNICFKDIREELQGLTEEKLGIIRSKEGLKEALDKLEDLLAILEKDLRKVEGFELQNLITLAYLITKGALMREESRGAHYRLDFNKSKERWKRHIVMKLEQRWEELKVEFE